MAHKLTAPRMGEGVEELTLVKWLKSEGDQVAEMEPVVEVETDKVATEIPSPASGVLLKIMAPVNQVVRVGEVLAWIGQPGEALETASPAPQPATASVTEPASEVKPAVQAPSQAAAASTSYSGFISPLVRKIASENKIDLNLVKGTGENGRITKQDLLDYMAGKPAPTAPMPAAPQPQSVGDRLIPHSSIRRQIAERMVNSIQTSPHVLTVMEADLSRVLAHRAANKELFAADGVNLTLTAYFIAAIAAGLKVCPEANSSWTDEGLLIHSAMNIGMAVALGDNGLIVPVIRDVEALSLLGIARQVNDLATRARSKKLLPEEVKGGTFSLTNHGTGGSLFASPIITQPQVGVLGTGMMHKRPVVVTDSSGSEAIAIRPMIYLSFVFDHRVLDGEGADLFLKKVKDTLETWKDN